jgi:hypothetical protein
MERVSKTKAGRPDSLLFTKVLDFRALFVLQNSGVKSGFFMFTSFISYGNVLTQLEANGYTRMGRLPFTPHATKHTRCGYGSSTSVCVNS